MLRNKLPNIQFAKYHIWNNNSEGFPNMVLRTETFNQSVRTEYSEAVNARYTFKPLWVSDFMYRIGEGHQFISFNCKVFYSRYIKLSSSSSSSYLPLTSFPTILFGESNRK